MKKSKTLAVCIYFYRHAIRLKPTYIVLLSGYILQMAFAPFINIIVPKYIIDELMGKQSVWKIIFLVAIILVGNFLFEIAKNLLNENRLKCEDWFEKHFTMEMSRKAMQMSFEHTESADAMDASQKADTGMSWYSGGISGLSDCMMAIVSSVITFLGIAAVIFTISPWLILITLIGVIINAYVTGKVNKAWIGYFNKLPAINKFYGYIYQRITNKRYAKEIRLYNTKDMISKKAYDNAVDLTILQNELAREQTRWSMIGTLVSVLSYVLTYGYLGVMAINGDLSVANFVMCITAIDIFSNSCLSRTIINLQEIIKKADFMKAYIDYMDYKDVIDDGTKLPEQADNYTIEFKNVSFKYPQMEEYTLKNVNITIQGGEHLSVVGENGAGKTTFIKLLCRLYDVTEGTILLNGVDIREYQYDEYIKLLSVVFQDFKLLSLSLKENVEMGLPGVEKNNLNALYKTSGIQDLVDKLDKHDDTVLYKEFDNTGIEPSGGESQKIAIARALYKDSPIVVLDEPTAALDPLAEYEIYKRFDSLIGGKTAVYISHRLSSCKFCDKIAVFAEKTIKEYGTHNDLLHLNDGLYAKMYQAQAKYYNV